MQDLKNVPNCTRSDLFIQLNALHGPTNSSSKQAALVAVFTLITFSLDGG